MSGRRPCDEVPDQTEHAVQQKQQGNGVRGHLRQPLECRTHISVRGEVGGDQEHNHHKSSENRRTKKGPPLLCLALRIRSGRASKDR